jgi:predicted lipid-binding transport protein (Tim44 family)
MWLTAAIRAFLGLIFGFPGLLLATLRTAMAIVLMRRFYRGDVPQDPEATAPAQSAKDPSPAPVAANPAAHDAEGAAPLPPPDAP